MCIEYTVFGLMKGKNSPVVALALVYYILYILRIRHFKPNVSPDKKKLCQKGLF